MRKTFKKGSRERIPLYDPLGSPKLQTLSKARTMPDAVRGVAESHSFDSFYDYSFTVSSEKDAKRDQEEAMSDASTIQLYPKYDLLFEDLPKSARMTFRRHQNFLPYRFDKDESTSMRSATSGLSGCLKVVEGALRLEGGANNPAERIIHKVIDTDLQCRGKDRNLYMFKPSTNVNVINLKLTDSQIQQSKQLNCGFYRTPVDHRRIKTCGTQTLYRESSAQTLPYIPNVSNKKDTLENLEIFKLPTILPGSGPPGVHEVEVLERARKRWLFAKCLRENFQRQLATAKDKIRIPLHKHILEAFEWERWIEREEEIQECQMLRLEMVIRMFDKREKQMRNASKTRIELCCERIEAKRVADLRRNEIDYNREVRRLEIKRRKLPRNWRKENIVHEFGNPTSEYYGPKLRYGANPSHRHFAGGRQAFEDRIKDLDKTLVNMSALTCPFAKLKEWSKPKGRLLEVEQRFCADANLQKLYESLKSLRKHSTKQKVAPKCLIEKARLENVEVKEPTSEAEELVIEVEDEIQIAKNKERERMERQMAADEENWKKFREEAHRNKEKMEYLIDQTREEELEGLLADYEGSTIGWLMRFLSEEMDRLQELRKLHFITMLAQKERWRREAAEAGLRQKENDMRRVYEQLFLETDVANKEVCQEYLEKILMVDTHQYAEDEATENVVNLAKVIDSDIQRWQQSWTDSKVQNPMNFDILRCLLRDIVFPDVEELKCQRETELIMKYIIDDVIYARVIRRLEPFDIATHTVNDTVDRLIDNDLYLYTPECSSVCSGCEVCECSYDKREAKAILRKLVRHAVPGRRWRTSTERIAYENVQDILDDVFMEADRRKEIFSNTPHIPQIPKQASYIDLHAPTEFSDIEDTDMESTPISVISTETVDEDLKDNKKIKIAQDRQIFSIDAMLSDSDEVLSDSYVWRGYNSALKIIPSTFDIISHAGDLDEPDILLEGSSSSDILDIGVIYDTKESDKKIELFLYYLLKKVANSVVPAEKGDSDDSSYNSGQTKEKKITNLQIKSDSSDIDVLNEVGDMLEHIGMDEIAYEMDDMQEEEEDVQEEEELFLTVNESELKMLDSQKCKCEQEINRVNLIRDMLAKGKVRIVPDSRNLRADGDEGTAEGDLETGMCDIASVTSFEYRMSLESITDGMAAQHAQEVAQIPATTVEQENNVKSAISSATVRRDVSGVRFTLILEDNEVAEDTTIATADDATNKEIQVVETPKIAINKNIGLIENAPITAGNEQSELVDGTENAPITPGNEPSEPVDGTENAPTTPVNEPTEPVDGTVNAPHTAVDEPSEPVNGTENAPNTAVNEPSEPVDETENAPTTPVNEPTEPVDGTENAPHTAVDEPIEPINGTENAPNTTVNEPSEPVDGTENAPIIPVNEPSEQVEEISPITPVTEPGEPVEENAPITLVIETGESVAAEQVVENTESPPPNSEAIEKLPTE